MWSSPSRWDAGAISSTALLGLRKAIATVCTVGSYLVFLGQASMRRSLVPARCSR